MDVSRFLTLLKLDRRYRGQIAYAREIPPRPPRVGELEKPLPPTLAGRLEAQGICELYSHQAEAINAIRQGEDVAVVSGTASGKTLCYNLPVFEAILDRPQSRALYLFPTKALAQDQLRKIREFDLFPRILAATYDGDTPAQERRIIKRQAHIVLTNPDMLHVGILPYHTSWAHFLKNLRFVVLDEVHTYRGVFGCHVANIMRRLRRLCDHYQVRPQFICCSATVANPGELVERLTGLQSRVVDEDGSPSGPRTFLFWNPPALGADGAERRSANSEATELCVRLTREGVRNIVFTKARVTAEIIARYARDALARHSPWQADAISPYRAGYTPEERRAIERALFDGKLLGVISTNALELGVDIGGLDACVMTGYPGTIASTWQQVGRAGRGNDPSLGVLIGLDNPLDQYLMRHPEYFFGRSPEHAITDPDNPYILESHLLCAAYEFPLEEEDGRYFGPLMEPILRKLETRGLIARQDRWYWKGTGYPPADVNIRSMSDEEFSILDVSRNNELLGTVEGASAFETVHPGAIYLHRGESYQVQDLDIQGRTAYVAPSLADYYTVAQVETSITIKEVRETRVLSETKIGFGLVEVTNHVVGYRRRQHFTDVTLGFIELDMPSRTFETEAFWFVLPHSMMGKIELEKIDLAGAIHAIEHATIGLLPLFAMCDRMDIGGVSHPVHPDTKLPTVFIYDGHAGGVGIAAKGYLMTETILKATGDHVAECPCEEGCPSCIHSPKCGNNNEPLDKKGAVFLIRRLLQTYS